MQRTYNLLFALLLPRGIWGTIERRTGLKLLPVGYRLQLTQPETVPVMRKS